VDTTAELEFRDIVIISRRYIDRSKFSLWTPPQNFHQITLTLYLLILFHCILCGVLVLVSTDSAFVCMCGTLERADLMEPIHERLQKLMATVDHLDTRELLKDTIFMIEMYRRRPRIVPEARLSSTRVCRQHFLQWDPQIFMPGPIWHSVSFPSDRDITDNEIYLFVAVLFFVDKDLRDGEPRVWRELCAAWDAKFGLAPGEEPGWRDESYGSLLLGGFYGGGGVDVTVQSMIDPTQTVSRRIFPGLPLDLAISGECDLLGCSDEQWLKDCLSHYEAPIESLERLHEVRLCMNSEGPRWWLEPGTRSIVWMPSDYWGLNDD